MIELIIIGVVIVIAMQQNKSNNAVQRNQDNTAMQTVKPIGLIWRTILFVTITPILMGAVWLTLCIGIFFVGLFGAEDLAMLLAWTIIPLALCWILYKSVRTTFATEMGSRSKQSWWGQTTSQEKKSVNTPDGIIQVTHNNNMSPETLDLMKSLELMNTGNIESVIFLWTNGAIFSSETENIKRLTLYIINKLQKTHFAPEELRKVYNHVHNYIASNLPPTEFEILSKKIEQFVREGGEVKIVTHNNSF
jgi:hypothetical protein